MTTAGLIESFRSHERSPVEVAREALERIEALDARLNAFVTRTPDLALGQAAEADRAHAAETAGPLAGIPIGVKDLEDAAGFVTTHGSPLHADDPPAETDSILVARLRADLTPVRGLAAAGAALDGVGIAACLGSASAAVTKITADLGAPQHEAQRDEMGP